MSHHLPPTILIIEPETVLRTNMSNGLERNGFNVFASSTGNEALKIIEEIPAYQKPNIVVLRDDLDGLSGIELCTIIKTKESYKNITILMVSDNIRKILETKDLENSYDDFILKPFTQSDFVQKIKSILGKKRPSLVAKILTYKDLKMDLASFRVIRSGREIHLGPTEFKILQCLIDDPKRVFSRDEIMKYVWGLNSNVEIRTIDVHVNRLRSALKQPNEHELFIKTVRSSGYCLEPSQEK
jgi:two-component system phosphate regulon response regulator PhoB